MPIHGYPGGVITANPVAPTVTSASGVWTTEQQLQNQVAGRWPPPYYLINRSLRFNSADSAYIVRQNGGTAGNRKVWTLSFWMKPSVISTAATPGDGPHLFMVGNTNPNGGGGPSTYSRFLLTGSSNNLVWGSNGSSGEAFTSTNVFRDLSAWYHVVVSFDATNTIIRCYVNNQEITYASRTNPSNTDSAINAANYYNSFGIFHTGDVRGWNGYLTEFNFIDGQALTPSSFGLNDPETGVWSPKRYTGTYGTNGFYLNFSDNSGTTSTTLGKDYSGNGNNWTPNNFSVTAGAGNDSLVDSPTSYGSDTGVGGEVRGNYATLNPLRVNTATLSNGNLDCVANNTPTKVLGTIGMTSGKWYWECSYTSIAGEGNIGIATEASSTTAHVGGDAFSWGYLSSGEKRTNSTNTSYGASYTTSDVIGVAFDADAGTLVFYKNGVSQGTAFSSLISGPYFPAVGDNNGGASSTLWVNFGQRPFAYTAPSGFKALCTQNLPTPTIGATSTTQANDYFNAVLYTGTGSSLGVTGVGFQPDWTWIKGRSGATDHGLYDAVRGVQKQLESNTTTAETTETTGLTAFNSDGFTVGALAQLNTSSATYVAWNWKANGAGSSNTAGTITSTVSANTTSGFSIVTWAGTSINASTIGHGLGVAPSMIITKGRTNLTSWTVGIGGISGFGVNDYLSLNSTNAKLSSTTFYQAYGSSTFTVGVSALDEMNKTGNNYVSYCFAPVAGYSAFGSYTGNGSTDGPFVYTGFRPKYVLIKNSSATADWILVDTVRQTYNVVGNYFRPNTSNAEQSSGLIDIVSNGFKIRTDSSSVTLNALNTYIYAAFAESPFKYSLAR